MQLSRTPEFLDRDNKATKRQANNNNSIDQRAKVNKTTNQRASTLLVKKLPWYFFDIHPFPKKRFGAENLDLIRIHSLFA